jgi:hypothetical protein
VLQEVEVEEVAQKMTHQNQVEDLAEAVEEEQEILVVVKQEELI